LLYRSSGAARVVQAVHGAVPWLGGLGGLFVFPDEPHQPRKHGPFDERLFISKTRLFVEVAARIDFRHLARKAANVVDGPAGIRIVRRHF
jgi:hypothetical protein